MSYYFNVLGPAFAAGIFSFVLIVKEIEKEQIITLGLTALSVGGLWAIHQTVGFSGISNPDNKRYVFGVLIVASQAMIAYTLGLLLAQAVEIVFRGR